MKISKVFSLNVSTAVGKISPPNSFGEGFNLKISMSFDASSEPLPEELWLDLRKKIFTGIDHQHLDHFTPSLSSHGLWQVVEVTMAHLQSSPTLQKNWLWTFVETGSGLGLRISA